MTRNLYLGADIDGILAIQDPNQVPIAIAQAWATIVSTNFPARAEALADEIAEARPHLIGLQEAVLYRRQSPSDYVLGNTALNASTVVYDFLPILMSALQARGMRYRVVARLTTSDLEFPMYTGQGPLPFDDIRWTDGDAILAREDVVVRNSLARVYEAFAPVAVAGAPLRLLRGWTSVDAVAAKTELRFVNTHLETQPFRPVQEAQTRELLQWLAQHHGTKIVVGDFNSAANPSAPAQSKTASYGMFRAAGFEDLWLRHERANEGLTCSSRRL
jgi:endonuclease/exonuclease/phosphatase family metal-dependent hydrolase